MKILFNDNWQFAEIPLDEKTMYNGKSPILFNPDDFLTAATNAQYTPVQLPHDWQIYHVKDLYKSSVGCYKKQFTLSAEEIQDKHIALNFEGVYMNSAVWVNGKKAGEWKYGYSCFEFDITNLVQPGENLIQVLAVYQNCNTRWYSGAGIFRDVTLITCKNSYLISDGVYFNTQKNANTNTWTCNISAEAICKEDCTLKLSLLTADKATCIKNTTLDSPEKLDNGVSLYTSTFSIENPDLWEIERPCYYQLKTELIGSNGCVLDSLYQHVGFKTAEFTSDKGFFLNGKHVKINGVCQHHDLGALGSAFNKNALRRQFTRLKEMGVNAVRCSHNPPPTAWLDLCDEMGLLVDNEAFDMWEKPKTPFDYGNYFNEWCERDVTNWVRKDRNHPSLIMWSIGNEIYDTHVGNGFEITKRLSACVRKNDPLKNAQITIGSNYMMCDGAQNCATQIDTVGYNYLERLYSDHHKKYPDWKIYGSETSSTVQSRGIYHFPETLNLVTFNDGQCSCLGNCSTPWSAKNTQTVITNERDCSFSAGQFIWTGWDYIGEPTPYHTKNSYFGQIDTAGFPKDTFFLYKSEWAADKAKPFVHLLPYWDWNEGQKIDVKAYTNCHAIELFFNGVSQGRQQIDHKTSMEPFGRWHLEYHKGQIKAVGYDSNGNAIAEEVKNSFEDPAQIVLQPETEDYENLFFIDILLKDKNGEPVENARNYITINVKGEAELLGMDNGDSTDYDEYKSPNGKTHSRKLFGNRLVAIIQTKTGLKTTPFEVTAASKDLPEVSIKWDGAKWKNTEPDTSVHAEKEFVPVRKIEIICNGNTALTKQNAEVLVTCKVLPENATNKEINWNPVLKECVSADNIEVLQADKATDTRIIRANCDGECILRCTAKNGSELDEIISDLNFTVSGVGNPKLNPYKLIEACRHNDWDKAKKPCEITLESGTSNKAAGPTWISFDKVDFGPDGADSIHIPIFTFETKVPVEVWDGKPGNGTTYEGSTPSTTGGECLGKFTYEHESIYNTYNENVFTLNKRLFGVHTISIVLPHELYFHGFYFDKTPKAYARLRALDCDMIAGDTFTKTQNAIEEIGNNVTVDFENMDFGEEGTKKLTICGKSNTDNNTLNIKFFGEGSTETQVIDFEHTDDYEEKSFELKKICGMNKVSFVFLPGCNFDFKYFRFE